MNYQIKLFCLATTMAFNCCDNKLKYNCKSLPELADQPRFIFGIIDSNYESKDHGQDVLIIKNFKKNIQFEPSTYLDHSFFSEYEVGDSLIKRAGFMDVTLIKQNGQKKIYKYNCFDIPHDTLAF